MKRRGRAAVSALALALLAHPLALAAQPGPYPSDAGEGTGRGRAASAELGYAAANAALGALTAGLLREVRGGSFREGVRAGALGGAVVYAGKRIAVERFDGAGLLGRQVGAVGGSMVRNGAAGRPSLSEVALPLWLVRVYLRTDSARAPSARIKVDLPTLVGSAYVALQPRSRLDPRASLSAGMPVFLTRQRPGEEEWSGFQAAGLVWLRESPPGDQERKSLEPAIFAHERVHVIQYEFGLLAWSDPLEGWLGARVPGAGWVRRRLDLGAYLAAWSLANALLPYEHRPWEREAHFLGGTGGELD